MRILYVITRGEERGGAQIHVRDLATALSSRGDDVAVVVGSTGRLTSDLEERGVPYFHAPHLKNSLNPLDDAKAVAELGRIFREFRPGLVSLHSTKAGFVGRIACRIASVPCIFTAHGWAFTQGVPVHQRALHVGLEFVVARWCETIICVSDKDRRLAESARIPHKKLITIHNGMPDIPEYLHARPGSHDGPLRVVMVGRLDRQKDHETLFKAVASLNNVTVSLVGDGPREEELEALAEELGIRDRINLLGYCSDVGQALSQHDLFVLTSHYEGFPRSTLEAMRAGLPVIVTDVGGASEAIVVDQTGYVVDRGDIDTLASLLSSLDSSRHKLSLMGVASRMRYEYLFRFELMQEKTVAVYEDVAASGTAVM